MRDQPDRDDRGIMSSRRGGVAILIAISLTALIGFAALGTEVGFALFKQRQMEATASAAALAGAIALSTGYPVDYRVEVQAVAATAGFTNGSASVTVTPSNPPTSGSFTGNTAYVQVVVSQPWTLPLSGLFFIGPWTINARAVAKAGSNASYCVLQLDSGSGGAVTLNNGVSVNLSQCGLAMNSTGSPALSVYGGANLTTSTVSVTTTTSVYGGGSINATGGIKTSQGAVADPYGGTAVPPRTPCDYNNTSLQGWQNPTIGPGVYCGGLTMSSGGTVKMTPGVYVINGGTFSVQGGTALTATGGVTIVLTGSGSNWASVSIGNGTTVTLSAPTTGATAGLVFFQDPATPNSSAYADSFQGGTNTTLTGALYFPSQTVSYSNGSSNGSVCTQLVAWRMTFTGGVKFNSTCAGIGVGTIGGSGPSQLVE